MARARTVQLGMRGIRPDRIMSPRPLVPTGTLTPAALPAVIVGKLSAKQQKFIGLIYIGLTIALAAAKIPWTTGNANLELHKIYEAFGIVGNKKGKLNEFLRFIRDELDRERQVATESETIVATPRE